MFVLEGLSLKLEQEQQLRSSARLSASREPFPPTVLKPVARVGWACSRKTTHRAAVKIAVKE